MGSAVDTPDRRHPDRQHIRPGGMREHVLSIVALAGYLRRDVSTLKELIKAQKLRAIRISPDEVTISEQALGEFMQGYKR